VAVDKSGNVYIADYTASRVMEYNDPLGPGPPNVTANLVFGQGSSGIDFTVSSCNGGGEINRFHPSATGACYPEGLTVDSDGDLWVADTANNRLLEYTTPLTTDVTADLVLGQSDFTHNKLNRTKDKAVDFGIGVGEPAIGMAVDPLNHVYVADYLNSRVLGWRNAAALGSGEPADLVIGQPDFNSYLVNQVANTPTAGTLNLPAAVGADGAGNLYVADYGNNRMLEYTAPFSACTSFPCVGGQANIVFGIDSTGKNFTTAGTCSAPSATDLCKPDGIAIDASGNVYVSDNGFGRVLEYNNPTGSNPPDVTANLVFGIDSTGKNFTARGGATITATSLDSPVGLAVDASSNLYVSDNNFNRVLEYNNPLGSGPPNVTADLVFGVDSAGKNFTSIGHCGGDSLSLCPPTGVALDGSGNLYITDSGFNRVLEYNNPVGSNPANVTPDLVFGQGSSGTNFTGTDCAQGVWDGPPVSATGLCNPTGVALDTQGNLYVVDLQNDRVVVYDQPLGGSSSAPTPTATLTPTATASATPTATATATPTTTATPSPTPTADAMLLVHPTAIRFPAQAVHGKHGATEHLVLRNPENGPLNASITIGSITSSDPQFQASSNCNGRVLAPGGRCEVAVTFTPGTSGPQNGTISIPSNARNGVRTVLVKGRGR
jgi:sugar lactone lactonase YvrE